MVGLSKVFQPGYPGKHLIIWQEWVGEGWLTTCLFLMFFCDMNIDFQSINHEEWESTIKTKESRAFFFSFFFKRVNAA